MPRTQTLTNLSSLGEMIGSLQGIASGMNEHRYMESIIKDAHHDAANAFDVAAASLGAAGKIQHVFEFGTIGVTKGQPKFPDPTAEAARLWVHNLYGSGGDQNIAYSFRPALNRNPIPTPESTGVASKYLKKISKRKYVFWNKAFVMETGQTVEIRAKKSDYLFVPFNGAQPRNPLNKRGFMMYNTTVNGPLEVTPGRTTKGTFSAFWTRWWGTEGTKHMEYDMKKRVLFDIDRAMASTTKRANSYPPVPVQTTNITGTASKARMLAKKLFGRKPS